MWTRQLSYLIVSALILASGAEAWAICRIVGAPGAPPPVVLPQQSVLVIKRRQNVDEQCQPPQDGGTDAPDGAAAAPPDAAAATSEDANTNDANANADDAGARDAGPNDAGPNDAGPSDAAWPCSPVEDDTITMVVQPRFRIGNDGATFALLMVTPSAPAVSVASSQLFRDLALATAPEPEVVPVYVEDESLGYQCRDPKWVSDDSSIGCSVGAADGGGYQLPDPDPVTLPEPDDAVLIDTVGSYQVARLQFSDADALATWLDDNGYAYGPDDLDALRPYIADGWTTVAVRVSTESALDGGLEPLSLTWVGEEIRLPLGVSRQSTPAEAWIAVYIAAEGRYDMDGGSVRYAQPTSTGGASFLTRSDLWVDLTQGADADPRARRVSGSPLFRETVPVEQKIRIPSSKCPDPPDDDDDSCSCGSSGYPAPSALAALLFVMAGALRASRRRRR